MYQLLKWYLKLLSLITFFACRFGMFDGSSAQHTGMGAYRLYKENAGPEVVVEQAPCGTLQACVYRITLTQGANKLVFDMR